jgi:hypothetical protein
MMGCLTVAVRNRRQTLSTSGIRDGSRRGCVANFCGCSSRLHLKCDGTRAETRFRLSAKRTSPFTSPGGSVQSTTGSRGVRISCSNAGYTMFRGSVKGTGYPLHSPVSPSLPPPVRQRVPSHLNWTLRRKATGKLDQLGRSQDLLGAY